MTDRSGDKRTNTDAGIYSDTDPFRIDSAIVHTHASKSVKGLMDTQTIQRRRWIILGVLVVGLLAIVIDNTVLNVALKTIASPASKGGIGASQSQLEWGLNSYTLVFAGLLFTFGIIGDRIGRKRVLMAGLVLFGLGSLFSAYSTSPDQLIAARAVMGLGGAAVMPQTLSIIANVFEPQERARAIGIWTSAVGIGVAIGPVLGGLLLTHFWWGSVFLINVPIVVLAVIAVVMLLPESRSANRPSIDVTGLAVSAAGLVALTYGFIRAGQDGWSDATAVGLIAAGVVLLALLVAVERRIAARGGQPLADLKLFASRGFRWGTILATAVSFAMFGIFFALPQYFQDVRGADALGSGFRLLPMVGGMLVGMVIGTRLNAPRPVVTAGYLLMAVAMGLGAFTTLGSSTGYTLAWVALAGLGLGLIMPPAMTVALGALSAERSGAGSALLTALRQVGSTIGVAVLGTVISNSYSSGVAGAAAGLPAQAAAAVRSSVGSGVALAGRLGNTSLLDTVRTAFVHGMGAMLWTCGGVAVGCALLALLFLPRAPRPEKAGDVTGDSVPGSLPVG